MFWVVRAAFIGLLVVRAAFIHRGTISPPGLATCPALPLSSQPRAAGPRVPQGSPNKGLLAPRRPGTQREPPGARNRAGSSAGGRRHPPLLTPRLRPPAACNRRPHFKSQRPRGRGGAPGSSGGRERGLLRAGPSRRRRPSTAGPASRRRAERRGTPGGERAGRGQRARRLGKMAGPRPAAGHAGTCSSPARGRAAGAAGGGTAFPVAPRAAEGGARRRAGCCCYIGNS